MKVMNDNRVHYIKAIEQQMNSSAYIDNIRISFFFFLDWTNRDVFNLCYHLFDIWSNKHEIIHKVI